MTKENEQAVKEITDKKQRVKDLPNEIEAKNINEEVQEILEKCIKCGMCKSLCPVFKTLNEEYFSPRGRTILMQDKNFDEILFKCNLCKACEQQCPLGIKVWEAVRKSREIINLRGKGPKSNKEMIKNVKECGNPFGKNPEKSEKLYCC